MHFQINPIVFRLPNAFLSQHHPFPSRNLHQITHFDNCTFLTNKLYFPNHPVATQFPLVPNINYWIHCTTNVTKPRAKPLQSFSNSAVWFPDYLPHVKQDTAVPTNKNPTKIARLVFGENYCRNSLYLLVVTKHFISVLINKMNKYMTF